MRTFLSVALLSLLSPALHAACSLDRALVKSVTDAQNSQVRTSVMPATIANLQLLPTTRPLPQDGRIAPTETTIYSVTATLVAYRLTPEGEIHLVLSDESRRTIMAKIPASACASGSRFLSDISAARAEFDSILTATDTFQETRLAVQVEGVGFFDFLQGQRGLAPNGLSLYPVIAIDFTPPFRPNPPAPPAKRRSVNLGGTRTCPRPTLSLTTSRTSACTGETATITWQASDAAARVSIDGIGSGLPASGNRVVSATTSTVFSGRASTFCSVGDEAVAVVNVTPATSASVSGPAVISTGDTTTLVVTVSGASSWTLTSSLGNVLVPNSGTNSRTVTYTASRSGTDTITLNTTGGCGSDRRSIAITVSSPPPTNTGLRCCDGTRSATCFDCSRKQGCCSSHGGVCGCS